MPAARGRSVLLAAARLYYLENRSQAEVARELGTSRSNVSRMLRDAQQQGLVEIRIVDDPSGRVSELERDLRAAYGLVDVRVAERGPGAKAEAQVGRLAAELLLERVTDSMTVGLSWGRALESMVRATDADRVVSATLVQLVGGLSSATRNVGATELVRDLADRLGASYRLLHAPAALGSAVAVRALVSDPAVTDALDDARAADLAFVGIGTPHQGSSGALLSALDLSEADQRAFWDAGPVGDIALRYYTEHGEPVTGAVDERVVALTLDELARIPQVVGVAYGRAKARGVLGALRGGLVDSLVCDDTIARLVLAAD